MINFLNDFFQYTYKKSTSIPLNIIKMIFEKICKNLLK